MSKEEKINIKYDINFKMIVIGDPYVGKTCLADRIKKDLFNKDYSPTVGFDFFSYMTKIEDKIIRIQIWDTCGQEVYRSLISNFYKNISLAMIVYAIDSRESFTHIKSWLKEIKMYSNPDVKIILVGNKKDLENERKVTYEEAKKFKEENQILYFEETSAKMGINAKEVFMEAAKILYEEYKKYNNEGGQDISPKIPVPMKLKEVKKKRKSGCC